MHDPTSLKYMKQGQLFEDSAIVKDIVSTPDGKSALILDETIFYPQGGGQPFDQGDIIGEHGVFSVEEVYFKDGLVYHVGAMSGLINKNDKVRLILNKDRRLINSKNHTAGHLIDIALQNLGMNLFSTKGYHFPNGAYVEYQGLLEENEKQQLKESLIKEINKLIKKEFLVHIQMVSLDELEKLSKFVPSNLPKDKPIRIMLVKGFFAIPCGGTHVTNLKELGNVSIDKIRNKKGNTRISYSVS